MESLPSMHCIAMFQMKHEIFTLPHPYHSAMIQKTAVEAVRPYGTVKEWDSGRMGGKIRLHTL